MPTSLFKPAQSVLCFVAASAILLTAALIPSSAQAQPYRLVHNNLVVVVSDTDGGELPGAEVTLKAVEDDAADDRSCVFRTLVTDMKGRATFRGIPACKYRLRVRISGFLDTTIGPLTYQEEEISAREYDMPEELRVFLNAFNHY